MLHERAEERLAPRRAIRDAMLAQSFTGEGTTPRTLFRFLAAPQDANYGGNAHGGTVLRWIDEAASACAASWVGLQTVAVYSGGIHFFSPIRIGDLVEVEARLIRTGSRSLHIAVHVRAASPRTPRDLRLTTHCMTIFVDLGADGRARAVPPLPLVSAEDRRLDEHALDLIRLRASLEALPA